MLPIRRSRAREIRRQPKTTMSVRPGPARRARHNGVRMREVCAIETPIRSGATSRRCRGQVHSGFEYGLVVGSSIALMMMVIALGLMKLLPEHWAVDVPVALAIVALGIAVTADL